MKSSPSTPSRRKLTSNVPRFTRMNIQPVISTLIVLLLGGCSATPQSLEWRPYGPLDRDLIVERVADLEEGMTRNEVEEVLGIEDYVGGRGFGVCLCQWFRRYDLTDGDKLDIHYVTDFNSPNSPLRFKSASIYTPTPPREMTEAEKRIWRIRPEE